MKTYTSTIPAIAKDPLLPISSLRKLCTRPIRVSSISLASALLVGFILRFSAASALGYEITPLERGYLETVATMESGYGPLMRGVWVGPDQSIAAQGAVEAYMKKLEQSGQRIDRVHRYPSQPTRWIPSTLHPLGYPLLLDILYRIGNYSGLLLGLRLIQSALDVLTALFVYVFLRNVFGASAGLTGAWVIAILPPEILLNVSLLPDALACVSCAAILACASVKECLHYAILTGFTIGLAAQVRSEFLLWAGIVIFCRAVYQQTLASKAKWALAMLAALLVTLSPWMLWTRQATGHALLTTTGSGAMSYEALGQNHDNPWGISIGDVGMEQEAYRHGFATAWTAEADVYYRHQFYAAIRRHPGAYLRLILRERLPQALVPHFTFGTGNLAPTFAARMAQEGLNTFTLILKHPFMVLGAFWPKLTMGLLSVLLVASFFYVNCQYRRRWRQVVWLSVPWLMTIATICYIKQIEPRNLAAVLVLEAAALAVAIDGIRGQARLRVSCERTLPFGEPATEQRNVPAALTR